MDNNEVETDRLLKKPTTHAHPVATHKANDTLSWTKNFTVSKEEADAISDPDFAIPGLIILGHVIVIAADPGAGKTTIFMHLAAEMAAIGHRVFYINADVAGSDAKEMVYTADKGGFELLLPDFKTGLSMNDVVANLRIMNESCGDYSGTVFIFDTLKKMTEVINKSKSKELYKTLRGLSAKGMTIILLAHTNKYKDSDGNPIYEGTGDLKSDVDELIYLIPQPHDDGTMTVSTKPEKMRGDIIPMTFKLDSERNVELLSEYVDVETSITKIRQKEKDAPIIDSINNAIRSGAKKQADIIQSCRDDGHSKRTVLAVLKNYSSGKDRIWNETSGMQYNVKQYELIQQMPIQ